MLLLHCIIYIIGVRFNKICEAELNKLKICSVYLFRHMDFEPARTVCECGSTFKNSKNMNKTLHRHLASDRHKILMMGGSKEIHDEIVSCRGNITGYKNLMQKLEEGT